MNRKVETQTNPRAIAAIFQEEYHAQIFYSRCQDTGQKPDIQKAKMFKESFSKINSKKNPQILNLYSMRLGVNTIMKLISILEIKKFHTINLADNSISEYGMHAVKSLISSTKIQNLNLASNMISEVGLSLILEEMIKNSTIKSLDLGILQGSIRKNSFGIDGARCLAAILLQNKTIQVLKLEDNDIGINGAQIISIPLKRNKQVRQLKISQNLIKTQGAEYILSNALNLTSLDLGKNFIKSSIGPSLKRYFELNPNLKKLNLEFNQLTAQGTKTLFEGIINSGLQQLNIRGNAITNSGIQMIFDIIQEKQVLNSLKVLDISSNELNLDCIDFLIGLLNHLQLTFLNLSKNIFTDEGIILFFDQLKNVQTAHTIQKIDISGVKMSDKGFMFMLQNLHNFRNLRHIKCSDNYISQKYQKVFIQLLSKNQNIISLSLQGNRLSLSGLKGIKKIIDKNLKNYQQKQPKKMKSQIYNLKQKQKKIKQAQQKIDTKKRQLASLEQTKLKLSQTLSKLQQQQKQYRNDHEDLIKKKMNQLQQFNNESAQKQQSLIKTKQQKQQKINDMSHQLQKLRERRKMLEYQLGITQKEGMMIEKDFERKIKQLNS